MDAYVVIGGPKSLKSSVIRCLTGCRICGPREFKMVGGAVRNTYVQISSLQEGRPGMTARQFVSRVTRYKTAAVILTLRVRAHRAHPDADSYLAHFINVAGWRIAGVALLNENTNTLLTPLPRGIVSVYTFTPSAPVVNQLAAQVRKKFRWI